MISITSDRFWKCYKVLPEQIRKEAKRYIEFLEITLIIQAFILSEFIQPDQFSLFITKDYHALGILQNNEIIWFWIGSHDDYDNLLKQTRPTV